MANTYDTKTVTTSATLIIQSNSKRKGSLIRNTSSGTVFLGMNNSVTTANGIPVLVNETFINAGFEDSWRGDIYGIVAASTSDVRFWEWEG